MIDAILAFLLGYYYKKSQDNQQRQPQVCPDCERYAKRKRGHRCPACEEYEEDDDYSYAREGESMEDLT